MKVLRISHRNCPVPQCGGPRRRAVWGRRHWKPISGGCGRYERRGAQPRRRVTTLRSKSCSTQLALRSIRRCMLSSRLRAVARARPISRSMSGRRALIHNLANSSVCIPVADLPICAVRSDYRAIFQLDVCQLLGRYQKLRSLESP